MNIYFIVWVIVQYYVIYFVAQIVPALAVRTLSDGSYVPLTKLKAPSFWGSFPLLPFLPPSLPLHFRSSFSSGSINCSRLILYILSSIP